jgi:hypothetical protein
LRFGLKSVKTEEQARKNMEMHPNSLANLEKGKRFSKTYKPANTGRRKDYLKEFADGSSRISQNDLKIIYENLIMDNSFGDLEKILARGQKTLPANIAGYIKGLVSDLKKGRIDVLERLHDRIYGKPLQGVEMNATATVASVSMSPEERKKRIEELLGKCEPSKPD